MKKLLILLLFPLSVFSQEIIKYETIDGKLYGIDKSGVRHEMKMQPPKVDSAYTVNGIPLKDIDVDYVQLVGTQKLLSTQVVVEVNFGQRYKFFRGIKENSILDGHGQPLILNSMVDALNFMSENGYEFVNAYVVTIGNQNVYHYLLKKKP